MIGARAAARGQARGGRPGKPRETGDRTAIPSDQSHDPEPVPGLYRHRYGTG